MISRGNYKKVHIHITTFKENRLKEITNMSNKEKDKRILNNKFICSICLNSKTDIETVTKNKSKPKCYCLERKNNVNTKTIASQTAHTDINKSLKLLNEVLKTFQSKKQFTVTKTVIFKDAGMSTEDVRLKPKLAISKMFQFSINQDKVERNAELILTSHEELVKSRCSIELPKHKSLSIPQMKLEELKNCLKEKTRSKDAIQEVNRMFATINTQKDSNRLRNFEKETDGLNSKDICKCCQTSVCMSSGDSILKTESQLSCSKKCENCIYMMCCNFNRKKQAYVMFCDRCGQNRSTHNWELGDSF